MNLSNILPFEYDRARSYSLLLDSQSGTSFIHITRALGSYGVCAIDQYYSTDKGKSTTRELSQRFGYVTDTFYKSALDTAPNISRLSLTHAILNPTGTNGERTTLAFRDEELPDGIHIGKISKATALDEHSAKLLFVALNIAEFLRLDTGFEIPIELE